MLALPPPDPGFELLIASQGMSDGISQTRGIQVIPRAFVGVGAFRVGGQWRNVDSPRHTGIVALFFELSSEVRKFQLDGAILYRMRTGVKGDIAGKPWGFSGSATRTFGRISLRIRADYDPKDFGGGNSLFMEFGPTVKPDNLTRISANVGRRECAGCRDYTSYNVGVSRSFPGGATLDARFYGTDRYKLGPKYSARVVVSARLAL